MSIHLVPAEAAEETYDRMSPRYMNMYKKTNEPIYVPNHETLNGLAVLTEVVYSDPTELEDPKFYYTEYLDLLKDVEIHKKLSFGTPITFTGKIGSENYQSKVTTYGRLRISKIIDADIDKIGIFSKPFERISSKSGARLYQYLYQFPDGVEKIRDLQQYALKAVTITGVVTFNYKTLYVDTDTETYKKICEIADSPKYSDKQKLLLMTEKYKTYSKELQDSYSDSLKKELSMANRVKLTSLIDMSGNQLIISGTDEKPIINRGNLLNGLTESSYQYHAIENRSLQSIKVMGVPSSGYVI